MFYPRTALCDQFELALDSWVCTFPTKFVQFCWCYNLGQKKNIYLFGYPTVPTKKYQPYFFFFFFHENLQKIIEDSYLLTKKLKICTLDRDIVKFRLFN